MKLLAVIVCLVASALAQAKLPVVDATHPFFSFWDAAQSKPESEQVRLFKQMVVGAHPELFTESVIAVTDNGKIKDRNAEFDKRIADYLHRVAPYVPAMSEIASQVDANLKMYSADFLKQFPDFAPKSPTYFTISMLMFDGGTRQVKGKTALLFGIDSIAYEKGLNVSMLFDHELFHQYHNQIAPEFDDDNGPIWQHLWEEGLATYVSRKMNPQAPEADALMFPHDLAERARPLLPQLAKELLASIDSQSKDEYAVFFYGQSPRNERPGRTGYYVGYLIAQHIAEREHLRLQQLAKLRGDSLKKKISGELEAMASAK